MFDLGFAELMVIGIVALIVVGPKDLPVLFRKVGLFMGKARGMAREFSRAMNEAADETGVRDVAKTLKTATNPVGSAMDGVKDAARSMTKLDLDADDDDDAGRQGKKGPATQKLSKERLTAKRRMEASTARANAARMTREAETARARADELERQIAEDAAAEAAKDEGSKA